MNKNKVAILFGGNSHEYDISLASTTSLLKNINRELHDIILIGISRKGNFYLFNGDEDKISDNTWLNQKDCTKASLSSNTLDHGFIIFEKNNTTILQVDVVFPMLHGRNGEDGRIQGLLELAKIPYVGCDSLSSAIAMDKYKSHNIVKNNNIKTPESYIFNKNQSFEVIKDGIQSLDYPIFIKPLKEGSSFGISKVDNDSQLKTAITDAFYYDTHIIIENCITGFEVGCSVLGNDDLIVGEIDEIQLQTDFFTFEEKYTLKTSQIHLPARISVDERLRITETAKNIYKAIGCSGFARVDMFYTDDHDIVFNEVNTIPGFTANSRYPNMLKEKGYTFSSVIDKLISLGLER